MSSGKYMHRCIDCCSFKPVGSLPDIGICFSGKKNKSRLGASVSDPEINRFCKEFTEKTQTTRKGIYYMKKTLVVLVVVFFTLDFFTLQLFASDTNDNLKFTKQFSEVVATLSSLAKELNSSPVGEIAYRALWLKYIFKPIFCIVFGSVVWITLNYLLWLQVDKFFGAEKHLYPDGRIVLTKNFEFRGDGAIGCGAALGSLAVIINLCGFLTVFGSF